MRPPPPGPSSVRALLCDADGCLFPSEVPAFAASTEVTNALLEELGVARRYSALELQRDHTGRNFRATAPLLCAENGIDLAPAVLERWVDKEKVAVTRHLARELRPDPQVARALRSLAAVFPLAVVSSSATGRVAACLAATALSSFFDEDRLFSAEDSLARPVSKPDPAIYLLAGARMGVAGPAALAIEDSEVGVRSAVAAGFSVVGLVHFAPADDADQQAAKLLAAGALGVAGTWNDLVEWLLVGPGRPAEARSQRHLV